MYKKVFNKNILWSLILSLFFFVAGQTIAFAYDSYFSIDNDASQSDYPNTENYKTSNFGYYSSPNSIFDDIRIEDYEIPCGTYGWRKINDSVSIGDIQWFYIWLNDVRANKTYVNYYCKNDSGNIFYIGSIDQNAAPGGANLIGGHEWIVWEYNSWNFDGYLESYASTGTGYAGADEITVFHEYR